jgi:hypothetical protein
MALSGNTLVPFGIMRCTRGAECGNSVHRPPASQLPSVDVQRTRGCTVVVSPEYFCAPTQLDVASADCRRGFIKASVVSLAGATDSSGIHRPVKKTIDTGRRYGHAFMRPGPPRPGRSASHSLGAVPSPNNTTTHSRRSARRLQYPFLLVTCSLPYCHQPPSVGTQTSTDGPTNPR